MPLTIISAGCGVGKSFATVEEAARRASQGLKTAITTPNHKNALAYEMELNAKGVPTVYRMAPHKMKAFGADKEDLPYCEYVSPAEMLADGGMSVKRELCEGAAVHGWSKSKKKSEAKPNALNVLADSGGSPCPFIDNCPAASGERRLPEGTSPLVWIGPHMLIGEAIEFVGYGLLIVDEPPKPIDVCMIGAAELDAARYAATVLHGESQLDLLVDAIDNGVRANTPGDMRKILKAGIATTEIGKDPDGFMTMLRLSSLCLEGDSSLPFEERFRITLAKTIKNGRPRLSAPGLPKVREGKIDRILSAGAKTLGTIVRSLEENDPRAGNIDVERKPLSGIVDGKLVVIEEAHHLRQALMRSIRGAPTVLLDATVSAEVLKAFMANFVQKDIEALNSHVEIVEADVEDAVPIERVWIPCSSANRKSWLPHGNGKLDLSHFVGPLRRAVEIACADPHRRTMGIIAYKPIVALLGAAWRAGNDPAALTPTARAIWEVLAPWRDRAGAKLQALHYGDLRGSNVMENDDVLVCLGDPWTDKTSTAAVAAVLHLKFDELYRAEARAELTQAVGRFRSVCRTQSGVIIVVGSIPPTGWTTENTRIEELEMGRPSAFPSWVRPDVLRAWRAALGLSVRDAAAFLGVSKSGLARFEQTAGQASPVAVVRVGDAA